MAASPNLDTLKKVASRSGVGFGTVRRASRRPCRPCLTTY